MADRTWDWMDFGIAAYVLRVGWRNAEASGAEMEANGSVFASSERKITESLILVTACGSVRLEELAIP